jgi:hypothetical protein
LAKTKIPNAIERRHLIERAMKPAQALRYAEAYLEDGRDGDAIDFLVKAEATEKLQAMRERAIESGDAFLLRAAAAALDAPPERDEWRRLAVSAESAGLARYAAEALRMADAVED